MLTYISNGLRFPDREGPFVSSFVVLKRENSVFIGVKTEDSDVSDFVNGRPCLFQTTRDHI